MWRQVSPFCTIGGNADWRSHCGKQYGNTSKNYKWILTQCILTQWFHFWEYIWRTQNTNLKEHKHPYVYCSIIYNHQDIEAAHMSINRNVDKTTMGHLHNGILVGHKKEENFTICNSMDGPGEHYAQWNKPVRERQIPYVFTHMWNLKNQTNKQNRDRLIDGEQADS